MNPKKVMIIDDEESVQKLLRTRFEREGYQVWTASSTVDSDAIFLHQSDIGLVVCDIRMPGKDGINYLKELKQKNPDRPVIMISGHGDHQTSMQVLELGAFHYVEKPFNVDELVHLAARATEPKVSNVIPFRRPEDAPRETYTQLKKKWVDEFEQKYLHDILGRCQGNVSFAAREAGLDRSNFLRLLRRHGIKAESYRSAVRRVA